MTTPQPLVVLPEEATAAIRTAHDAYLTARRELNEITRAVSQKVQDARRDVREALAPVLAVDNPWQVDISYAWECPHSPIGTCIFTPKHYGCRFCGDPEERK